MTPRYANPQESAQALKRYRADHRIIPRGYDPARCAYDDIPIYRIKNGWRHDPTEIHVADEKAPIGWPKGEV
jgi:hypothetical protein